MKTTKNEKTAKHANAFGITMEGAELSLKIRESFAASKKAESKARADYEAGHVYLSGVYPKYAEVKFNAVSRCEFGSEKYHEKLTEIASEHSVPVNVIKEIHGFIMSLSTDTKERASMTQSLKRASERAEKAEKAETEKTESAPVASDTYAKVLKTLCSQYQHLGKVEEMDENVESLINDIGWILDRHGVDLETL